VVRAKCSSSSFDYYYYTYAFSRASNCSAFIRAAWVVMVYVTQTQSKFAQRTNCSSESKRILLLNKPASTRT
jgi:hypothetical protein